MMMMMMFGEKCFVLSKVWCETYSKVWEKCGAFKNATFIIS
jgi:hypothetical protein